MDDTTSEWRHSVERRLGSLETDVAVIRSNYATKEDLARLETELARLETRMTALESRLIRWFFATATGLSMVAFAAGRYLG